MQLSSNKHVLTTIVIIVLLIPIALILYFSLDLGPAKPILQLENQTQPKKSVFGSDLPEPYYPKAIENLNLTVISGNPNIILDPKYSGKFLVDEQLQYWYFANGAYFLNVNYKGENHSGVAVLHPINETAPRSISQDVKLPEEGRFFAVARVANIEYMYDALDFIDPCETTADNVIIITVTDLSTGKEEQVYASRVVSDGSWYTVGAEITKYKGKSIRFTIKSYAGGSELLCGEWGAVEMFYIAQSQ